MTNLNATRRESAGDLASAMSKFMGIALLVCLWAALEGIGLALIMSGVVSYEDAPSQITSVASVLSGIASMALGMGVVLLIERHFKSAEAQPTMQEAVPANEPVLAWNDNDAEARQAAQRPRRSASGR